MNDLGLSAEEVVTELYRSLLMREPDEHGLRAYSSWLRERSHGVAHVVRHMLSSNEFRGMVPSLVYGSTAFHPDRFTNDRSLHGEVELLLRLWVNGTAKHRIVVDVGAQGAEGSNSYDLLRTFGWKGILTESDPSLLPVIRDQFQGVDFSLVHCAVADYEGTIELRIAPEQGVVEGGGGLAAGTQGVHVPVLRIGTLLRAQALPRDFDVLCISERAGGSVALNDLVADGGFEPQWVIMRRAAGAVGGSMDDLALSEAVRSRFRVAAQTAGSLIFGAQ